MNEIKNIFITDKNELSDGSILFEIIHVPSMERIATAETEKEANDLEMTLNLALTDWSEKQSSNVVEE